MKIHRSLSLLLAAAVLGIGLFTACQPNTPGETTAASTESAVPTGDLSVNDGLSRETFLEGSYADEWLTGCSRPDRNDHFDAYILRHEEPRGEGTVYTFLVYYPHGAKPLQTIHSLTEDGETCILDLTYTEGGSTEGYTLTLVTLELPGDRDVRVRLNSGENILGTLLTVAAQPIVYG